MFITYKLVETITYFVFLVIKLMEMCFVLVYSVHTSKKYIII